MSIHRFPDQPVDLAKPEPSLQKRLNGNLIGRIQHRRHGSALFEGLVGKPKRRISALLNWKKV